VLEAPLSLGLYLTFLADRVPPRNLHVQYYIGPRAKRCMHVIYKLTSSKACKKRAGLNYPIADGLLRECRHGVVSELAHEV